MGSTAVGVPVPVTYSSTRAENRTQARPAVGIYGLAVPRNAECIVSKSDCQSVPASIELVLDQFAQDSRQTVAGNEFVDNAGTDHGTETFFDIWKNPRFGVQF